MSRPGRHSVQFTACLVIVRIDEPSCAYSECIALQDPTASENDIWCTNRTYACTAVHPRHFVLTLPFFVNLIAHT